MYQEYFKLDGLPFENVPDPRCFFDEGEHSVVLKRISSSIESGKGLIVVTGPIGSGKTTLSHMVIAVQPETTKLIWVAEPPDKSLDLFQYLASELGVEEISDNKTFVMGGLRKALSDLRISGKRCLLIIDESHLMSLDVFNAIRLLNNLEEDASKLILVLMLGQQEILEKIQLPELEPFRQRISALEHLGKLSSKEVIKYVAHRLHSVSGGPSVFSRSGWEAVSKAFVSGGTPRMINSLCDRSLRIAYEDDASEVRASEVFAASKEIGLDQQLYFHIAELIDLDAVKNGATASSAAQQASYASTNSQGVSQSPVDEVSIETISLGIENKSELEAQRVQNQIDSKELESVDDVRPSIAELDSIKSYLQSGKVTKLSDLENQSPRQGRSIIGPLILFVVAASVFYFSLSGYCGKVGKSNFELCIGDAIQHEILKFSGK